MVVWWGGREDEAEARRTDEQPLSDTPLFIGYLET